MTNIFYVSMVIVLISVAFYTVYNHIRLYLDPDSICATRILFVLASDSNCEQTWTCQLKEQKRWKRCVAVAGSGPMPSLGQIIAILTQRT